MFLSATLMWKLFSSITSASPENPRSHTGESPTVKSLSHQLLMGEPAEVVVVVVVVYIHRGDSGADSDNVGALTTTGSCKSRNDFHLNISLTVKEADLRIAGSALRDVDLFLLDKRREILRRKTEIADLVGRKGRFWSWRKSLSMRGWIIIDCDSMNVVEMKQDCCTSVCCGVKVDVSM